MTFSTDPPCRVRSSFSQQAEALDRLRSVIGDPVEVYLVDGTSPPFAAFKPVNEVWTAKTAKALVEAFGDPTVVDGYPDNGSFIALWNYLPLPVRFHGLLQWLPVKWIGKCSHYPEWQRRQAGKSQYRDAPSYTGDVA